MGHLTNTHESFDHTNQVHKEILEQRYIIKISTINSKDAGLQYEAVIPRGVLIDEYKMLQQTTILHINQDCENLIKILEIVAEILETLLKSPASYVQDTNINMVYGFKEWILEIRSEDL